MLLPNRRRFPKMHALVYVVGWLLAATGFLCIPFSVIVTTMNATLAFYMLVYAVVGLVVATIILL